MAESSANNREYAEWRNLQIHCSAEWRRKFDPAAQGLTFEATLAVGNGAVVKLPFTIPGGCKRSYSRRRGRVAQRLRKAIAKVDRR